jgi:uncharacterized protein (DUF1697 family)
MKVGFIGVGNIGAPIAGQLLQAGHALFVHDIRHLEARLQAYAGKVVGVAVRTAAEMAEVLAQNPFADAPGNRVVAIFLDEVTSPAVFDNVMGRADDEELRLGRREIYVRYGAGMTASKLRIPAATKGAARNMNTVAKLVAMAATDV